jgi:hypothetical protein
MPRSRFLASAIRSDGCVGTRRERRIVIKLMIINASDLRQRRAQGDHYFAISHQVENSSDD